MLVPNIVAHLAGVDRSAQYIPMSKLAAAKVTSGKATFTKATFTEVSSR